MATKNRRSRVASKAKSKPAKRPLMTRQEAAEWKRRWRAVNRAEIDELRRTPLRVKLKQLGALMASAEDFGLTADVAEREEQAVRALWRRLHRIYRG